MAVEELLVRIDATVKTCTRCGRQKAATPENFRPEPRTKIGLNAQCRDCEREYKRARRRADPELDRRYYEANKSWLLPKMNAAARQKRRLNPKDIRACDAKWRNNNRDKTREYSRKYYSKNRDKVILRLREYYENNPEKKAVHEEKRREWRRRNRDQARSYVRNRRARIKEAGGTHGADDIAQMLSAQRSRCWWCGDAFDGDAYEVDHRVPIAKGGSNGPDNIVISCSDCNRKKNQKMPWETEHARLL